jgi:hypothetical protein
MRRQLRMIVAGVVVVVIAVASIVETPGAVELAGFAVVVIAMMVVIQRERSNLRR